MEPRRATLVEQHLPLVEQTVLRVSSGFPRYVDRSELVAAGMLGLVEAALRFDFDRAVPFAGFAFQRIRGAVLDVARSTDWAPRSTRQLMRRAEDVSQELAGRGDGDPTDDRVAAELGIATAELRRLRERANHGVLRALDERSEFDGGDVHDLLTDRTASEPAELLEDDELRGYLRDALATLPERHRLVVIGIYLENRTFEELAELLGVTPSRVSQLRADAVVMMRDGINAQYEPRPEGRPKGRVAIRQARYASEIARRSDWRGRLDGEARPEPEVLPDPASVACG